jgi:signal transduction histidine kinase/DNA-binding response OmpR family regulator
MKLSVKFGLLVLVVLAAAVGGSYGLVIHSQRENRRLQEEELRLQEAALEQEVKQRAFTVASFGEACRDYTQQVLAPALDKRLPNEMIFEGKSRTFVARGTFELFRNKPGMSEYSFREASLNPLNEKNHADGTEERLIRAFAGDRSLKEQSGFYRKNGVEVFFVARPIVVEASCLQCHDTPQRAPREIRERYGESHGFGWKDDEINSILMVTVPAEDLRQQAAQLVHQQEQLQAQQRITLQHVLLVLLILAGVLPVLLYCLFEMLVHRRLSQAAAVMQTMAEDPTTATRCLPGARDEIGMMAEAFNSMADSLSESHQTLEKRVAERTADLAAEVTERKRAEEAADEANRAKSAFLATMSHEIRTPMHAVLGMAGLLSETPLTMEQREQVRVIRASGDALLALIDDILDFSRIEAGQLRLQQQTVVLRDLFEESLDLVASRAARKRLELVYHIGPDVPAALRGDRDRLRQILVNLLGNAVKFTEGGEVVLSVEVQHAQGKDPNEATPPATLHSALCTLHFSVKDTGVGIAPENLERLFQSFTQVDTTTARRHGGTGLGLAISKRLCALMGGSMMVESKVGQGSTFSFTLPVEPAPGPPLEPMDDVLKDRRLLIVEDHGLSRQMLRRLAEPWGVVVQECGTAAEALERLRSGATVDAVLVDMNLPETDGTALARALQERAPGRSLRLVALVFQGSSSLLPRDRFAATLSKPVRRAALHEALRSVFADQPLPIVKPLPLFDTQLAEKVPLRILLAEDAVINQKLMLAILGRLGYRADVAADGKEVLEALERRPYDLILMDVQMPGMDGLEATRRIRAGGPNVSRPRIIALTANALKEDRDVCLAAGMDDYLSKPVDMHRLQEALARCGSGQGGAPPSESSTAAMRPIADAATEEDMDARLLAELRHLQETGRPNLIQEMLTTFRGEAPRRLAEMRSAVSAGDPAGLIRAAHQLKGVAGSLGARRLAALCAALETQGRSGVLHETASLLADTEKQVERACVALEEAAR